MKIENKKAFVPLAVILALALIPTVLANDNIGVTVNVETPHILPFTAKVIIATGLGFPVLLFALTLFKAKNYNDVAWIMVAIIIALAIIVGITQTILV